MHTSQAGATAGDDRYGDLTADIVVGGDVVDNETPDVYVITYDVMDREGNAAAQVTRTVTVTTTDVSLPVISLNGPEIVYLNLNDTYSELGATAYDGCDPNLPAVTVDNSAVNTGVYGEYTVTYNVTDSSSNAAVEVTRTVRVWPALTLSVSGAGFRVLRSGRMALPGRGARAILESYWGGVCRWRVAATLWPLSRRTGARGRASKPGALRMGGAPNKVGGTFSCWWEFAGLGCSPWGSRSLWLSRLLPGRKKLKTTGSLRWPTTPRAGAC